MNFKFEVLKRFKKIEKIDLLNNQHHKQKIIKNNINDDFNKRKKNDENLEIEEDKFNDKNNKHNNKAKENDKKFKFDNFNKNLFKSKLYR